MFSLLVSLIITRYGNRLSFLFLCVSDLQGAGGVTARARKATVMLNFLLAQTTTN